MAYINKNVSTMAMPSGMNRMGQFPLDMSSVYYDLDSLQNYATSGAIAYVGQILSLVDEINNSVTLYAIKNTAGDLVEIAADIIMPEIPEVPEYSGGEATEVRDYKINVLVDNETIKIVDGKLTAIIPEIEIPEYIDTNTTYNFAFDKTTQKLTVTPSEGDAVELDLSDFLTATELPEDKNTEYHLEYNSDNKEIKLVAGADASKMTIDATPFIKDGMLNSVVYTPENNTLTFYWNTDAGIEAMPVVLSDIIEPYTAGEGLKLEQNKFSVVVDSTSEEFLTVSDSGVKLDGVQDAIDEALQAAKDYADNKEHVDTNTTYDISALGVTVTLTPSEGEAQTATLDAYTKSETDKAIADAVKNATGGESASDVLIALNNYKKAVNAEVWGDSEITDEALSGTASRIDTLDQKVKALEDVGSQANIIESVVGATDNRLSISTSGKTVTIDDANLRTDIATAKQAGTDAGVVAARAESKADTNANAITALETAKNTQSEAITALQNTDITLGGKITALETTVNNEVSGVAANYAAITKNTSDISTLNTTVGTHTSEIADLKTSTGNNATTITNLQTAISNVYTKTEADGKFVVQESGKSLISNTEIERLANVNNYDDTAIRTLITNITKDDGAIATAVATEAAIARAAEKANADEIARVNGVLVAALENDAEGLDSIKELADWINTHGNEASNMSKAITANTEAIAAIYTPAEGETAASGVLVTEIAGAKAYADNAIAATLANYKVKDVDNETLQLNENGIASVKAISTDLLVQGNEELIFCAGDASGYHTTH